jgi:maleamate amidohydrolase
MTSQEHRFDNLELRRQYEAAGFLGRVGWGRQPALLVIDMAGAWITPDEMLGSDLSSLLRAIVELLQVARRAAIPIYFTTMAYESPEEVGSVVSKKLAALLLMIAGSARVQLAPQLERRPSEPLLVKPRPSAFFGTQLLGMLIEKGADTLIVTGCSTSGCVRATCEDAFNHNLHVIVPAEAVGDRSSSAHQANLFDIDARYADVMPAASVAQHLIGLSSETRAQLSSAPGPFKKGRSSF